MTLSGHPSRHPSRPRARHRTLALGGLLGLTAGLLPALAPTAAVAAPGDPELLVTQFRSGPVVSVPNDGGEPTVVYDPGTDVQAHHTVPVGDGYVVDDVRVSRFDAEDPDAPATDLGPVPGGNVIGTAVQQDGAVLLGYADDGAGGLERLDSGGTSTTLLEDVDVLGLDVAPDGRVFGALGRDDLGGDPGLLEVMPDGSVDAISVPLESVFDVAVDPAGGYVLTDQVAGEVHRFDGATTTLLAAVPDAAGVAVEADGDVYVSSESAGTIVKVPAGTTTPLPYAEGLQSPTDVQIVRDPVGTTLELSVEPDALVATVTPATDALTPLGDVVFTVDGEEVGTAPLDGPGPDGDGEAVLELELPAGTTTAEIAASYDGDTVHLASTDTYAFAAPTITGTVTSDGPRGRAGWSRSPVTVSWDCEPGSAPIASCSPDARRTTNGVRTVTGTALATDGGRASETVTVRIDRARPMLFVRGARTGPYPPGSRPLDCRANDAHSGVASCTISYTRADGGDRVRWRAVARDVAGNTRIKLGSYRTT